MKVKICGITHPDDASFAASKGANFIGVIFSSHSKRMVSVAQAKEICGAARENGAQPVAVFVTESVEKIMSICEETEIKTIQLHDNKFVDQFGDLAKIYTIFFAIPVSVEGTYRMDLPNDFIPLFDSEKEKNKKPFDWKNFTPPNKRWILAGGLNKNNVASAIRLLNPYAVDVASGVEYHNSIRKNPTLVRAFIQAANEEYTL